MTTTEIADRQFTIETYLKRSARDALPLDRGFLQKRSDEGGRIPGPLHEFIKRGREPALEQYLLAHAFASQEEDGRFDVRLPGTAWARAIGGHFDRKSGEVEPAALHLVSRNWRFLQERKLIARERVGRRTRIWLLADDGSGGPYIHAGAGRRGKQLDQGALGYFQLPYAYWRDRWHEKLDLPAKAMLLIGLSLGDGFPLPYGQAQKWYGISASTAERGLTQLHDFGLLFRQQLRRADPESPVGFADTYYYMLNPPFGPRGFVSSSAHANWMGALTITADSET